MYELTVTDSFAAAHVLKGYEGGCEKLHGHTFKIEVTLVSGALDKIGFVVDFTQVKEKLKAFLKELDHSYLNEDVPYFKTNNPTTENLAKYIYQGFAKASQPFKIKQVKVWESDDCCVAYHE